MNRYALIFLIVLANYAQAQWFESSASAIVIDNDWDNARDRAVKKAVQNALAYSGGTVSSLQQVSNGVLVENKLVLNSEGEIKALVITNEQKNSQEGTINVDLRVDIEPSDEVCDGGSFAKSMAVARFKLNTPVQATDGGIFEINQLVSNTLFNQLKLSPQKFDIRQFYDYPVKLGVQYQDNNQIDTLHALASNSDSQFLVYGEINDISVKFASKNSVGYWISNPDRHFYITIYLYDALQGKLISSKQYRTQAPWQYGKHETVNLKSKAFWQKDYGQVILALLDEVGVDLAQQLQCYQPTAKVVSVESNSLRINLGANNGLKTGTIVSLFYSSSRKDQFGIERSSATQYQGTMKVIEVDNNSAILRTLDNLPLGNIQINDLARIK